MLVGPQYYRSVVVFGRMTRAEGTWNTQICIMKFLRCGRTDCKRIGVVRCGGGEIVIISRISKFCKAPRRQVSEHGGDVDVFFDGCPQQAAAEGTGQKVSFFPKKKKRWKWCIGNP